MINELLERNLKRWKVVNEKFYWKYFPLDREIWFSIIKVLLNLSRRALPDWILITRDVIFFFVQSKVIN